MKPAKILYFINGPLPTKEQRKEAEDIKASVHFRNAQYVPSESHALEICDGVAGEVPEIYKKAFPNYKEALKKKAAEFKELTDKVGDEAPPQLTDAQKAELDKKPPQWNANK